MASGARDWGFESLQGHMATKTKREFSAGGVVYKKTKDKILWSVCKHSGYHKWVLPKGIVEPGEKSGETALREVKEETGIKAKLIAKIPEPETYVYQSEGTKIFKRVVYFLMEYVSGKTEDHSFEMEEVVWLPYKEALKRLQFKGAKEVLKKARKLLEELQKQQKLF